MDSSHSKLAQCNKTTSTMKGRCPETGAHLKGKRLNGHRDKNRQVSVPKERKDSENETGSGSQGRNLGHEGSLWRQSSERASLDVHCAEHSAAPASGSVHG